MSVATATDVVQQWQPDQHLYVKGDVGVSAANLAELEQWLDANGPHWTVVLLQHARAEAYQAADGRAYSGMDAVEVALGKGLSNRTGFGRLEHAQTRESDGTVFVLYLSERQFAYFASDAQDRRGLGESHWIGELDRDARRAMQGGGRILDAVKDTVNSINRRLDRAIAQQRQRERLLEQQRQHDLAEVGLAITAAQEAAQQVQARVSQLSAEDATSSGPMLSPPVSSVAADVK